MIFATHFHSYRLSGCEIQANPEYLGFQITHFENFWLASLRMYFNGTVNLCRPASVYKCTESNASLSIDRGPFAASYSFISQVPHWFECSNGGRLENVMAVGKAFIALVVSFSFLNCLFSNVCQKSFLLSGFVCRMCINRSNRVN